MIAISTQSLFSWVLKFDRPYGRRVLRFDNRFAVEGGGLPPLAAMNNKVCVTGLALVPLRFLP
ncbi:hypothetical protein [uncultured Dialister sp.]|uniref:hypothetical protein n=1 Tax=uncultured Dialister sp. TaxID=278064 RepID=UPI0026393184|nr:hypothetical protein [uncultured Dialister sp.]